MTSGLRFSGGDTQLLAEYPVEQRGFSYIRSSDYRYIATFIRRIHVHIGAG